MGAVPIIFTHRGLPFLKDRYLRIALRQARLASPANPIYVLTDWWRPRLGDVTQVKLSSLGEPAAALRRVYRHASSNRVGYERGCFERWWHIREFMQQVSIQRAVVLDSDIMLFSPIEHLVREFDGSEAGNWSWANVVTSAGIDIICQHLMRTQTDTAMRAEILRKYDGLLSDMTALAELPRLHGAVLDQGYQIERGFDVNFSLVGGERSHRFHFLHFQGDAKRLMAAFAWMPDVEVLPTGQPAQLRPSRH